MTNFRQYATHISGSAITSISCLPKRFARKSVSPLIIKNTPFFWFNSTVKKDQLARHYTPQSYSPLDIERLLFSLTKRFNHADTEKPFANVLLVGVQHMLSTTVDMFSVLKTLGLNSAIVGGKPYSTHLESVKRFENLGYEFVHTGEQIGYGRCHDCMRETTYKIWDQALNKIKNRKYKLLIVLDDGADLLLTIRPKLFNGIKNKPDAIVGIEQTRGGSNLSAFASLPFPIINVAGASAKNIIEYPWEAEVIAVKMEKIINNEIVPQLGRNPRIGIIGHGSMGSALANKLIDRGFSVIVYDKKSSESSIRPSKVVTYPDASLLIGNADIIIGCTGEDITVSINVLQAFLYSMQKRWLFSAGSKDFEFNTLLGIIQNKTKRPGIIPDPLQDILFTNRVGVELEIRRGGFPINFDN